MNKILSKIKIENMCIKYHRSNVANLKTLKYKVVTLINKNFQHLSNALGLVSYQKFSCLQLKHLS